MAAIERAIIGEASRPRLARSVMLREDKARGAWRILAPERVFTPDPVAIEVLRLCDGQRDCAEIARVLALSYEADAGAILADILPMLQDLADKGVIEA
ncbi:MAG: pyrroloquinoline quinone biosynthesis peptide chaperone PqqD [Hyphomicrobiaceae bacterium]|nr:pyrroloquinoline quinone biosynthesis peptide chaperone PqqD [Hyphomicrobiaceae bacterium]